MTPFPVTGTDTDWYRLVSDLSVSVVISLQTDSTTNITVRLREDTANLYTHLTTIHIFDMHLSHIQNSELRTQKFFG